MDINRKIRLAYKDGMLDFYEKSEPRKGELFLEVNELLILFSKAVQSFVKKD